LPSLVTGMTGYLILSLPTPGISGSPDGNYCNNNRQLTWPQAGSILWPKYPQVHNTQMWREGPLLGWTFKRTYSTNFLIIHSDLCFLWPGSNTPSYSVVIVQCTLLGIFKPFLFEIKYYWSRNSEYQWKPPILSILQSLSHYAVSSTPGHERMHDCKWILEIIHICKYDNKIHRKSDLFIFMQFIIIISKITKAGVVSSWSSFKSKQFV
jgi:hypothetical protein